MIVHVAHVEQQPVAHADEARGIRTQRAAARCKWRRLTLMLALLGTALAAPRADATVTIYRCDGRPALYTTDVRLAGARQCRPLPGGARKAPAEALRSAVAAEKTVDAKTPELPARDAGAAAVATEPSAAATASGKSRDAESSRALAVPPSLQRVRDGERLRILQEELESEQHRLTELKARLAVAPQATDRANGDLGAGQLERAVKRSEQSIAALQREVELAQRSMQRGG